MRLGWRSPRANTFQGPDADALKGVFGDLQRFQTWPHFDVVIDDQALTNTHVKKTITPSPGGDPYSLVRSDDTIQVPRDFTHWMFVGLAGASISVASTRTMLSWAVDNAVVNHMVGELGTTGIGPRIQAFGMMPLKKGQFLQINALNQGLGTIEGRAIGFFLPLA